MTLRIKQPRRFRPRWRHLLFLFTDISLVLGPLVPILRQYDLIGPNDGPLFLVLVAPWILVMLFLVFERQGPAKYWAALVLLSFCLPAAAVYHDWLIFDFWRSSGTPPSYTRSLLINFILIGGFLLVLIAVSPDRCPRCGHRSLIPLVRFWGKGKRTAKTRWCGSCGAQYWRQGQGLWQKERRVTWVDDLTRSKVGEDKSRIHEHKPLGIKKEPPSGEQPSA